MKAHSFIHEMTTNSGIFGRHKDVQVVFEGSKAYTDGKRINLPSIPRDVDLTQEQIMIMRGYVDHEAGHLRHTDMDLFQDKAKRWQNSGKPDLIGLFNQIEDIWMEARVMEEYPGSVKNLKQVSKSTGESFLTEVRESPELLAKLKEVNVSTAGSAIHSLGRRSFNLDCQKECLDLLDPNLVEHANEWVNWIEKSSGTEENIRIAKAIYKLLKQDDPELSSKPEEFDSETGDSLEDGDLPKDSDGEDKGEGGEFYGEPSDEVKNATEKLIEGTIPGGIGCPQGDHVGSYKVYSTAGDVVLSAKDPKKSEVFLSPDSTTYYNTRDSIRDVVMVIKNQLRRVLQARDRREWDGGREIGRLDTKRLVSAYNGNKMVFKKRIEREEMNTAVLILVDLSGSMSGRKAEVAQQTAVALSECFEGTSIKYSVAGFKAMYHNKTPKSGNWHRIDSNVIYNFKTFDQSLRQSKDYIAGVTKAVNDNTYGYNNADCDAIMWAVDTLNKREENRKVLMVLSDGRPANETMNVDQDELVRHAGIAVQYGSKKGIECIGIGIQSDAVEKIYPDYVVVHDVKDLSEKVFKKFSKILLRNKEDK